MQAGSHAGHGIDRTLTSSAACLCPYRLRRTAGDGMAAYTVVKTRIIDPQLWSMWVRMADLAPLDACAMRIRMTRQAVWLVSVLDMAEGAVQVRMSADPVLYGKILHCMAVHAVDICRVEICTTVGWSCLRRTIRADTAIKSGCAYNHADDQDQMCYALHSRRMPPWCSRSLHSRPGYFNIAHRY